jgi:hypothetical protein
MGFASSVDRFRENEPLWLCRRRTLFPRSDAQKNLQKSAFPEKPIGGFFR